MTARKIEIAAAGSASLGPATSSQRMALALRMQDTVEQGLAAVERVLDKVAPAKPDETERSARTLASISHTLRDFAAVIQPDPCMPPANETDNDPVPRDMDEFRRELARRLQGLIEAHADSGGEGESGVSAQPEPSRI